MIIMYFLLFCITFLFFLYYYFYLRNEKVVIKQTNHTTKETIIEQHTIIENPIENFKQNIEETKNNFIQIDLLEKPKYSMEREIIVDDEDIKFYRAHFEDFADEASKNNGLLNNVGNKGFSPIDELDMSVNFSNFDKNDVGYLGTNVQNVHSSLVQDTIKNKYQNVKIAADTSKVQNRDIPGEIINFTKHLRKDSSKIKDIINQISKRNSFVKNMNDTELNVLNNSWITANNNIKEQIINELLDITDDKDFIVCPTGVTSRIVNSNIVENPESTPVTEADIRQEMLLSASKIRNDLNKLVNFQNLSESEQTTVLQEKLIQKYNKDYDGIISRERIKKELNTWINDI